ncbi:MAG: chorismate lyase [Pseudomonadota bacterium]|nr:chorismate lyase [Pseudomonadota bacterium]
MRPRLLPGSTLLSLEAYRSWAMDPGSLTHKIRNRCNLFSVQLLHQGIGRLLTFEIKLLGSSTPELSQVREVLLMADGLPVVYARSILPLSLARRYGPIRTLGERPLGDTLFTNKNAGRKAIQIFRILPSHPLYPKNLNFVDPLYARASIFSLNNQPLLVTDVFLPAILKLTP